MKTKLLFLLLFAVHSFAFTAYSQDTVEEIKPTGYCNYYGEKTDETVYTFSSEKEADEAINKLLKHTGLARNFVIKSADVPNAAAVIQGSTRYILYNISFMRRVKDTTKTDWAALSIMAHELGHHLQGHTLQGTGSRPPIELEADEFSGFVMYKMGATLEQAQIAMANISSDQASPTHPAKKSRLAAIDSGWTKAKDLGKPDSQTPSDPTKKPEEKPPVQAPPERPSYVARCVFPQDPVAYFVTSNDDIIGIAQNGQPIQVGKKIPPTVQGFVWMYSTPVITYGVDSAGRIWSRDPYGRPFQVGYVTKP